MVDIDTIQCYTILINKKIVKSILNNSQKHTNEFEKKIIIKEIQLFNQKVIKYFSSFVCKMY